MIYFHANEVYQQILIDKVKNIIITFFCFYCFRKQIVFQLNFFSNVGSITVTIQINLPHHN